MIPTCVFLAAKTYLSSCCLSNIRGLHYLLGGGVHIQPDRQQGVTLSVLSLVHRDVLGNVQNRQHYVRLKGSSGMGVHCCAQSVRAPALKGRNLLWSKRRLRCLAAIRRHTERNRSHKPSSGKKLNVVSYF
jgi:hypothetical protein